MGLFIPYSYSLLCWIIVCCILCLPQYLPTSLSSSSIRFFGCLPGPPCVYPLSSPASTFPRWFITCLPYTLWSALLIACTPPASPVDWFPHSSSDPFVKHYLLIKRLLAGARPHCCFVLWLLGPTPQGSVTVWSSFR